MGSIRSCYENIIFPKLMEMNLSCKRVADQRRDLLSQVSGKILEIGFGTGLNMDFYPKHIQKIVAIDSSLIMERNLQNKLAGKSLEIAAHNMSAETMDFPDECFDNVVSTFTLCSISNPDQALREICRVLRPGGSFFFLEHGQSPNFVIRKLQDLSNPLFNSFACGCNVNRNIPDIIISSGMVIQKLKSFYLRPRISGYTYKGTAVRPA